MTGKTKQALLAELEELRARLDEAEEGLRAIREGECDAIVVRGSTGERVFSLAETDNVYRLMVETMNEAGLAVSPTGVVLFANNRLGAMLELPLERLVGRRGRADRGAVEGDRGAPREQRAHPPAGGVEDGVDRMGGLSSGRHPLDDAGEVVPRGAVPAGEPVNLDLGVALDDVLGEIAPAGPADAGDEHPHSMQKPEPLV